MHPDLGVAEVHHRPCRLCAKRCQQQAEPTHPLRWHALAASTSTWVKRSSLVQLLGKAILIFASAWRPVLSACSPRSLCNRLLVRRPLTIALSVKKNQTLLSLAKETGFPYDKLLELNGGMQRCLTQCLSWSSALI